MAISNNLKGAGFMTASLAGFALNDACMKLLAEAMPVSQAVVLRGVATSVLIGGLVLWFRAWSLPRSPREWGLLGLRTLAEIVMTWSFLEALVRMPIANLHAIMQALPLTVALGAALFLREPLGWRRLSAIAVGFLGVLLIVRPGPEGFNPAALYGLLSVASITARDLVSRRLPAELTTLSISFLTALVITFVFGLSALAVDWAPVDGRGVFLLLVAAFAIFVGYFLSLSAMRIGDLGFTAPFRYTGLLWALILGWAIFGDWPSLTTLIGAAVVVATGIFTLYRERLLLRQ